MSKYEAETKYIYVNTENLESQNGGDQLNNIKVNLGTNTINSDDNSLIKISLTQFNMNKGFYNVNDTNNTLRIFQPAFTQNNFTQNAFDDIVKIDIGDYVSFEVLLLNLCRAIEDAYQSRVNSGTTVSVVPHTHTAGTNFISTSEAQGQDYGGTYVFDPASNLGKPNTHIHEKNTGLYAIAIQYTRSDGGTAFTAAGITTLPVIECLHIPPSKGRVTLSDGRVLTADEQYNDSYILLGIPRQTTYNNSPSILPTNEILNTFAVINEGATSNAFTVMNTYPISQSLNTMPYVYLRANLASNVATTNHENLDHNHQGNVATSHILGKIPRHTNTEGHTAREIVHFQMENIQSQSMVITQNMINELRFSVTDSKGRVIPHRNVHDLSRHFGFGSGDAVLAEFNGLPNVNGGLFCDFTLKVERLSIPFAPNILQGTPDINRNSVNPISAAVPIKFNNTCGF